MASPNAFNVVETTIADIHSAYQAGRLSARQLVQLYLDRIDAYDKKGPRINALISLNPRALEQADRLDAAFKASGFVGPLHGIPIIIKDQGDVTEMPTTLGSVLFKDHMPKRDAFVVARLKKAGAIFVGKATLGELGAGDTHGSLFGSTRNVYDLERTAGGSSGGSAAGVSANFSTVAVGQEGFASIRRPAIWNGVVGHAPDRRSGQPQRRLCRLALHQRLARADGAHRRRLGETAGRHGRLRSERSRHRARRRSRAEELRGVARQGRIERRAHRHSARDRWAMPRNPDRTTSRKSPRCSTRRWPICGRRAPKSIDPIVIPDLNALLAKRANNAEDDEKAFREYFSGSANAPFASREDAMASPLFAQVLNGARARWLKTHPEAAHYDYLKARDLLMTHFLKVMADHRLDAIVHKAVEHQPTLIKDGVNPPYVDQKGAPHINTFLVFVPSIVVPAGFTRDDLPAGITFLGRPYDDAKMVRFAYAYEQSTHHRRAPASTP